MVYPVSLIVCSRNRPGMLLETLQFILTADSLPAELLVVDQSSAPDERISSLDGNGKCHVRYIWTNTSGLSLANNLGVLLARHDIVAFTHDDVLVERDWLGFLVHKLLDEGPGTIVTGRVMPTEPEVPGGFAPTLRIDSQPATYRGRIGKDVLKPLNMAMYRSAIEKVGGFDTRLGPGTSFPGAEDSDLGFRLLEAGYRIVYVPDAVLHHRAWREPGDYLPLRWQYGLAQGAFFAKHARAGDLHMLRRMLRDWIRRLHRFPFRLFREGSRGLGDPLYMTGNVVGALKWWRGRYST